MADAMSFPMTRQGVRDLDHPISPGAGQVNVGATERAFSTLGGALLAGYGTGQGGLWGLIFAAAGAGLIYRGATGHCSLYAATGVNTAR